MKVPVYELISYGSEEGDDMSGGKFSNSNTGQYREYVLIIRNEKPPHLLLSLNLQSDTNEINERVYTELIDTDEIHAEDSGNLLGEIEVDELISPSLEGKKSKKDKQLVPDAVNVDKLVKALIRAANVNKIYPQIAQKIAELDEKNILKNATLILQPPKQIEGGDNNSEHP
jgi:hypothetical protein